MNSVEKLFIDYSLVIPAFNEEKNVGPLVERIKKVMSGLSYTYEIIIVDNGSHDSTPFELKNLLKVCPELVVITLTRNFGYDGAIVAGLENIRGKKIIILDGDQQDPPEVIPEFISKSEEGADIVYGIRLKRTEGWFISIQIKFFYRLIKKLVNFDLPEGAGNFGIMSREVADMICLMPERNKFIRGLRAWSGFSSVGLVYEREERPQGDSKFSFSAYLNHALNGITSFSTVPLRLFTYIGIVGIAISLLAAFLFFVTKIFELAGFSLLNYKIASGTTTLTIMVLTGISLNFLGFGIIGEYLGRVFEEVKNRPSYIVRNIAYGKENDKISTKNLTLKEMAR
ncbi:MAG: glycosyltransferase family 2 protein [Nitrospina sp.]|nr:glycosyltransferase family 2 protein [Nitrospina sp.]MBT6601283.1 glycosyltransferase family 2 protein [Nitrospina sp.]